MVCPPRGQAIPDNTSSDVRSLDAYNVHDARVRWMWNRPNGSYVALTGYLRNFLDAQYSANGWAYFYPDGAGGEISEVYVYPQAGRHGLLASNSRSERARLSCSSAGLDCMLNASGCGNQSSERAGSQWRVR